VRSQAWVANKATGGAVGTLDNGVLGRVGYAYDDEASVAGGNILSAIIPLGALAKLGKIPAAIKASKNAAAASTATTRAAGTNTIAKAKNLAATIRNRLATRGDDPGALDPGASLGRVNSTPSANAARAGGGGADRTYTHFTNEAGATGITGTRPLAVGERQVVNQLQFAKGQNSYIIGEGRIGVTDLGLDATPGQLDRIGVFGPRQQYAVQFSELDAFNSGVRVAGDLPSRNIFSIPGECTITGTCTVTRVR